MLEDFSIIQPSTVGHGHEPNSKVLTYYIFGQIIATSHDRFRPNGGDCKGSPRNFQGNLGRGEILFHLARYILIFSRIPFHKLGMPGSFDGFLLLFVVDVDVVGPTILLQYTVLLRDVQLSNRFGLLRFVSDAKKTVWVWDVMKGFGITTIPWGFMGSDPYMCQGLNSHYFHIIGDGHQPNSRGLGPHYQDSVIKGGRSPIPNTRSLDPSTHAQKSMEA